MVVGNNGIGKTTLLMTYYQHEYPSNPNLIPTVFERFNTNVMVDGREFELQVIDSDEEYELNRKTIKQVQVVIICFSLISPKSYEDVETRWMKLIKKENSKIPLILIGTKADMRDDFEKYRSELEKKGLKPISQSKGNELKEIIGAEYYFECSALKQDNLTDPFIYAAQAALYHKSSHCTVF